VKRYATLKCVHPVGSNYWLIHSRKRHTEVQHNPEGVFEHTTDKAAFVDRIEVSIDGEKRAPDAYEQYDCQDFPIASKRSVYAHVVKGTSPVTGNKVALKYGNFRHFEKVPPLRLQIRSCERPATYAEVLMTASHFVEPGFKMHISEVEMTYDVTGYGVPSIRSRLLVNARSVSWISDGKGNLTVYAGTRLSDSQGRVYQKTHTISRIELILRRSWLLRNGFIKPHQLIRLGRFEFERMLRFRRLNPRKLRDQLSGRMDDMQLGVFLQIGRSYPFLLRSMLSARRISECDVFEVSGLQPKFVDMQRNFIW
jgi:hypothetical protein